MKAFSFQVSVLLLSLAIILSACGQQAKKKSASNDVNALLKRKKICRLTGEENYDSIKYEGGRDAAFAYSYILPRSFEDSTLSLPDDKYSMYGDTTYAFSADKHATIKIWVGETVSFPLGAINVKLSAKDFARVDSAAAHVILRVKQGKYPYLRNCKIDELCYGYEGYTQNILFTGHNKDKNFVCKINLSEIPVSGDLIEKNIIFEYDAGFEQYKKLGITVVNEFSGIP